MKGQRRWTLRNSTSPRKLYKDFRKVLEQKDIDAVIVGTPDHRHCLITVYALQAGKHVYVEKPMANTIEECNIMVKAGKYYNKQGSTDRTATKERSDISENN